MLVFVPVLTVFFDAFTHRLVQAILFLILGRSKTYITILGFVALGTESTLPIPQLIRRVCFALCPQE